MKANIYDVAEIERAKPKKIYPKGTITIALSATKGQLGKISKDQEIESRYAAIVPKANIDADYMFYAIESEFEEFCIKNLTGMNLKIEQLKELHIQIVPMEKQKDIARILNGVEEYAEQERRIVEEYEEMKGKMLEMMFP